MKDPDEFNVTTVWAYTAKDTLSFLRGEQLVHLDQGECDLKAVARRQKKSLAELRRLNPAFESKAPCTVRVSDSVPAYVPALEDGVCMGAHCEHLE